jgi:hypothetical protein
MCAGCCCYADSDQTIIRCCTFCVCGHCVSCRTTQSHSQRNDDDDGDAIASRAPLAVPVDAGAAVTALAAQSMTKKQLKQAKQARVSLKGGGCV